MIVIQGFYLMDSYFGFEREFTLTDLNNTYSMVYSK